MNYIDSNNQVVALAAIREANPNMSIPEGADLASIGYRRYKETPQPTDYNKLTHDIRQAEPIEVDGVIEQRWEVYALDAVAAAANITAAKSAAWERIKTERDRRKALGVRVGQHWFHSDDPSRIQQLALVMMGAGIPQGLQWKTLINTDNPVFVEMTSTLAQAIFQATALNDQAVFAAAEAHRVAMLASEAPEAYDFSGGWPETIFDTIT